MFLATGEEFFLHGFLTRCPMLEYLESLEPGIRWTSHGMAQEDTNNIVHLSAEEDPRRDDPGPQPAYEARDDRKGNGTNPRWRMRLRLRERYESRLRIAGRKYGMPRLLDRQWQEWAFQRVISRVMARRGE